MSNVAPVTVEPVEPPHAPATIAAATAKVASSDLFRMCFLLIGLPIKGGRSDLKRDLRLAESYLIEHAYYQ